MSQAVIIGIRPASRHERSKLIKIVVMYENLRSRINILM